MTAMASTSDGVLEEVQSWLQENWDPDLTVGEWWDRLGRSGWAVPTWPEEWFGKGLARGDAVVVAGAIAKHGALGAPAGLGLLLAGPTILTHGTEEQKQRYLPAIVTGQEAWCQLFSEPEAGSDLAGLRTLAVRDGEEWMVNGQKVWTSGGQYADQGMLLARTDPSLPKHRGISYFAIDMHQPGIDIRPLREMTGRALFNEVFLSDSVVPNDALIGGEGNGWAVGNTTLAFERAGLGAGGTSAASTVAPGSVAGMLGKRVGDHVSRSGSGAASALGGFGAAMLFELAKSNGTIGDPVLRQDLMKLYSLGEIARFNNVRAKAAREAGRGEIPGVGNLAKLSMSEMTRMTRDLGPRILGPGGMLMGPSAPGHGMVAELTLFAPAVSIYGGSDQVQRNIIGERVLGLPSEPRTDKDLPFSELRTSAPRG